jgi:hypothetical protein
VVREFLVRGRRETFQVQRCGALGKERAGQLVDLGQVDFLRIGKEALLGCLIKLGEERKDMSLSGAFESFDDR